MTAQHDPLDPDARRLSELGYSQDLKRGWSGFQNFAISFSIISVLAGPFTSFSQAWLNGGPLMISIGWPLVSALILIVGFCMAELASSYPTAGGIYYWASKLGGPAWGWFTGWFNLVGLIAVVASVDYAAAAFSNALLGMYGVQVPVDFGTSHAQATLNHTFGLFVVILALHAIINITSSHLVALLNQISAWWHIIGVAVIVFVLVLAPTRHQDFGFVFLHRLNMSGFGDGMYWYYVLPLGMLLPMYTIVGYDASAHISEETHNAATAAPKGVWRSIFYSALIGWILLLALTFAATDLKAVDAGGGTAIAVLSSALSLGLTKFVILISTIGQFFCGMACVTSASRMAFAFSRDGAVPGHRHWSKLNAKSAPTRAVVLVATLAVLITLPALKGNGTGTSVAFLAVTSISVIGMYVAYAIPIFLRWRIGDAYESGPWTLGRKYRWMNPVAFVWVGICAVVFCLPFTPAAVPFRRGFSWESVNYAPLVTGGTLFAVGAWWLISARRTFSGPIRTVTAAGTEAHSVGTAGGTADTVGAEEH
ncbi:amino acid permease [Streptomyces sp. NPDC088847]|uniref:amino acid permease n=1 Tax=Streptomyces sp. NPDC088847 TaxID=3365909 RepID=UPI003822C628